MSVEDMLEAIKKQLENHENRICFLEAQPQNKEVSTGKKLSVKEFLISKKPKTDIDKTLIIGYYLENSDNCLPFNAKDIENGFRNAKETSPKNVNDVINKNIRKGFMMEAKEKKDGKMAWELTNLGEQCVVSGFDKKK